MTEPILKVLPSPAPQLDQSLLISPTPDETVTEHEARLQNVIQTYVKDAIQRHNVTYGRGSNSLHQLNQLIGLYPAEGQESDREFAEEMALSYSLQVIRGLFADICHKNGLDPNQGNISIQVGSADRDKFTLLDTRDFEGPVDFRIYIPPTAIYRIIQDISDVVGRIYSSTANKAKLEGLGIEERRELVQKSLQNFCGINIDSASLNENLFLPFEFEIIPGNPHGLQSAYISDLIKLASGLAHEVKHIKQALDHPEIFEQSNSATRDLNEMAKADDPQARLKKIDAYVNDEGEVGARSAEIEFLTSLRDSLNSSLLAMESKFSMEYVKNLYASKHTAMKRFTNEIEHLSQQAAG